MKPAEQTSSTPPASLSSMLIPIEAMERAVYARNYEAATKALTNCLDRLEDGGRLVSSHSDTAKDDAALKTRVASVFVALMADPKFVLSQAGFEQLVARADMRQLMFTDGYLANPGYLQFLLGTPSENGQTGFAMDELRKLLALSYLDWVPGWLLDMLPTLPPAVTAPSIIGLLSQQMVVEPQAESARQKLIAMASLIETAPLSDLMASICHAPWMVCSYSDMPDKHQIKRSINRALTRWMSGKGIRPTLSAVRKPLQDRPTLLVVLERFTSKHAMFRCYAKNISSLREKFHLVALSPPGQIDSDAQQLFDEVHLLQGASKATDIVPSGLVKTIAQIEQIAPDIVYFPSIGMSRLGVWLANLRLAPIQFMGFGHPASSFSPQIDYIVSGSGNPFDPALVSETVVLLEAPGMLVESHKDAEPLAPVIREYPDTLRIAVPAAKMKLSATFIALCKAIVRRSKRPVEFHFFPNTNWLQHGAARASIQRLLPGSVVYPRSNYNTYIANLNQCDLALSAFPFGSSNSAVDVLRQAVPMVGLHGPEPHAGTERRHILGAGSPAWLVVETVDDYLAAALRLIENDVERVEISQALIGKVDAEHFSRHHRDYGNEFLDTICWLYGNHEAIKSSGRKVWTTGDRQDQALPIA